METSDHTIDDAQKYSAEAAAEYSNVGGITDAQDDVERSINAWFADRLKTLLPESGVILDAGCGSGRVLPNIRGGERNIIGVDASLEMLRGIPGAERQIINSPGDIRVLKMMLGTRNEIFIHGDLEVVLSNEYMESMCDEAVSSFNAVCFAHPRVPVDAIHQALRENGRIYFISNAFVPDDVPEASPAGTQINLHDHVSGSEEPESRMFRHVLHTQGGDVPLQDHVHDVRMLSEAFAPDKWEIDDARIFPADGCEHLTPDHPLQASAFSEHADAKILHPGQGLTYVKVGITARKKAKVSA